METPARKNNLTIVDIVPETQNRQYHPMDIISRLSSPVAKTSFLIFKDNKYFTVLTENIAYFYVKYGSSVIVCFDKREYFVSQSLEQIQKMVTEKQFFRINRQYLISFQAVKEVELYFARKLLVNLVIGVAEKLLVPRDKATSFLGWLENR